MNNAKKKVIKNILSNTKEGLWTQLCIPSWQKIILRENKLICRFQNKFLRISRKQKDSNVMFLLDQNLRIKTIVSVGSKFKNEDKVRSIFEKMDVYIHMCNITLILLQRLCNHQTNINRGYNTHIT